MAETPVTAPATVPEQPEAGTPLNKKQPLLILLFIILLIFVISSVVNAGKRAAPAKSQMAARPAAANPQQVKSFETLQEQTAKKDQEEQQQRLATAALLAQIQGAEAPGPESPNAPPMTAAQRAALYGPNNPDAPQATSQMSERQAHPYEEAQGFQRLLDMPGYDVSALVEKSGKSASHIYARLSLLQLIPTVAEAFTQERISSSHANLIARLPQETRCRTSPTPEELTR